MYHKGKLSKDRVARLEQVGMKWDISVRRINLDRIHEVSTTDTDTDTDTDTGSGLIAITEKMETLIKIDKNTKNIKTKKVKNKKIVALAACCSLAVCVITYASFWLYGFCLYHYAALRTVAMRFAQKFVATVKTALPVFWNKLTRHHSKGNRKSDTNEIVTHTDTCHCHYYNIYNDQYQYQYQCRHRYRYQQQSTTSVLALTYTIVTHPRFVDPIRGEIR
jgi:hypothetical protein